MSRGMKVRTKYEVGDVIRVRCLDGIVRRIIVDTKENFDGFAGFIGRFEHSQEECWGYDMQIESTVKRYK